MSNRFDHIKSQRRISQTVTNTEASPRPTVKPEGKRIGRDAYDTLMSLLAEDTETPTTPYGVLVANSTKRNIKKQIKDLFKP